MQDGCCGAHCAGRLSRDQGPGRKVSEPAGQPVLVLGFGGALMCARLALKLLPCTRIDTLVPAHLLSVLRARRCDRDQRTYGCVCLPSRLLFTIVHCLVGHGGLKQPVLEPAAARSWTDCWTVMRLSSPS